MRSSKSSARVRCELLECRRLLDGSFGLIEGQIVTNEELATGQTGSSTFTTIGRTTVTLGTRRPNLLGPGTAEPKLFTADDDLIASAPAGLMPRFLTVSVDPGSYEFREGVGGFFNIGYKWQTVLSMDRAPGRLIAGTSNIDGKVGRDLGSLQESTAITVKDFIGYHDISSRSSSSDLVDNYFIGVPRTGKVDVSLRGLVADPDGTVAANVTVFRDTDNDGFLETSESLGTKLATPGQTQTISLNLTAGQYVIVVSRLQTPSGAFAGSNYNLDVKYVLPDGAGNNLSAARNIGTLGASEQTFTDTLSALDTFDFYRFDTVAGGPFSFLAELSGLSAGANFSISLIRDADADLIIDAGEVVTFSSNGGNVNELIDKAFNTPGRYYLSVQRSAGESAYTLKLSNASSDLAGNNYSTARNTGSPFFLKTFSDTVASFDTDDFYRVVVPETMTLRAQTETLASGDVTLTLLRDDGDGVFDVADVLQSSNLAGTASESVSRSLTAGTYFLRVGRVAGSPNYRLIVAGDRAGSTLSTATALTLPASRIDSIGVSDTVDVYRFNIATQPRRLGVVLRNLTAGINFRLGRDLNNDGTLNSGEIRISGGGSLSTLDFTVNLTATGTYFLELTNPTNSPAVGTNYSLNIDSTPIDDAGNTIETARNIGVVGATSLFFQDAIALSPISELSDNDDFYRFDVGENGPFNLRIDLQTTGATGKVEIIRNSDFDNVVDAGEVLTSITSNGFGVITLNQPGPYFARVTRPSGSTQFTYLLQLQTNTLDNAGNTLATAQSLGELSDFSGFNVAASVGAIDPEDLFRFTVAGPKSIQVRLSNNGPFVEVIRDIDGDNLIDPEDIITSSIDSTRVDDLLAGVFLPAAGTYFARVRQGSEALTNTQLLILPLQQLPFLASGPVQITQSAAVKVQVENYDLGGEGIAYHDNTANNVDGVIRLNESVELKTTGDAGGGHRTSNSSAGEFLRFTVLVKDTGLYDINFRVAALDAGARLRLKLDDSTLINDFDVPDTNGFDTFTTVSKPGILITAGAHILTLEFRQNTTGNILNAGNVNFIEFVPRGASVGTFVLPAAPTTVFAGQRTKLSLEWTVSAESWRSLKSVQLRLVDEFGAPLWVKFDEATNSLSLWNEHSRKFGPAKTLGSNGVLSNGSVKIHLSTTRIQADGPADRSVVLTLDLEFQSKLRGRQFVIEAAGADDFGRFQDFTFAGNLRMT